MLAAGAGRRFGPGGAKLLVEWRGRPLLAHVLDRLAEARAAGLIAGGLVVRPPRSEGIAGVCRAAGVDSVVADDAETGLAASLAAGLAALRQRAGSAGVTAALVLLGDQPVTSLEAIRAVIERSGGASDSLVRPRYAGPDAPGHPAVIGRDHWALAEALRGDRGFAPVVQAAGLTWTEVPLPGDNPDIDTPDDLLRLDQT